MASSGEAGLGGPDASPPCDYAPPAAATGGLNPCASVWPVAGARMAVAGRFRLVRSAAFLTTTHRFERGVALNAAASGGRGHPPSAAAGRMHPAAHAPGGGSRPAAGGRRAAAANSSACPQLLSLQRPDSSRPSPPAESPRKV